MLTAPPPKAGPGKKAGRPRKRGQVLPKPEQLASDERQGWKTCNALLYGEKTKVRYKDCLAQWYRACGVRLLRIVVVAVPTGKIKLRVFFCTDVSLSVREILEGYAARWSIETCFRNLKQLLGFADSSARKQEAVERTAPFVGFIYSFLVLWFVDHVFTTGSALAAPPVRPWYRHKQGLAFADVLRTAQRVLAPLDVLDPGRGVANLHQSPSVQSTPSRVPIKRAA